MYRPGKQGKKPDVLTQQSQDILKGVEDVRQQYQFQTLLQGDQLDDEIKNIILYATGASTDKEGNMDVKNKNIVNAEDYLNDLTESSQNNLSKDVNHDNNTKNVNLTSPGTGTQDLKSLDVEDASCSEEQITRAYKKRLCSTCKAGASNNDGKS